MATNPLDLNGAVLNHLIEVTTMEVQKAKNLLPSGEKSTDYINELIDARDHLQDAKDCEGDLVTKVAYLREAKVCLKINAKLHKSKQPIHYELFAPTAWLLVGLVEDLATKYREAI